MRVLVVNAGSSSLKLAAVEADGRVYPTTTIERWEAEQDSRSVRSFLDGAGSFDAVGHRVVHGGPEHSAPAPVDAALVGYLQSIAHLAPLHNPRALAGIRDVGRLLPDVPAVACFDTAFHARLPEAARTYALPRAWNKRWALRRYGFHGLSHAYAVRRGAEIAGRPLAGLRVVSCHLGAGASLAAVRDGASVDTTMGFTPQGGLVMKTRPGSLDPGLMLWLLRETGCTPEELERALEQRSGLAGLSGTSGDMRDVLAARSLGDADAAQAYEVFVHRLSREIAAMTAATHGLDLLVMTGGIGEHTPRVRAAVADRLPHLGVALDPAANAATSSDGDVSDADAAVRMVVVTAREDLEIARETRALLARA